MKIALRTASGWSKYLLNRDKERCDSDGARLWVNPGGNLYCDLEHDDATVKEREKYPGVLKPKKSGRPPGTKGPMLIKD